MSSYNAHPEIPPWCRRSPDKDEPWAWCERLGRAVAFRNCGQCPDHDDCFYQEKEDADESED